MDAGTMIGRMALAGLLAASLASAGAGATLSCDGGQVGVAGADAQLAMRMCRVAETALEDLAACNLAIDRPVTISLVDALPPGCMGLYHCGEGLIELLPPEAAAAARAPDSPFRTLSPEAFYDSLIVHELTHVAFDAVPCPLADCPATAEYLAYAMQVRSLAPENVAAFEAASNLDGPVSGSDISFVILQMAPNLFAAEAWAHFAARPDPCGYAGLIAEGTIRFDREHP